MKLTTKNGEGREPVRRSLWWKGTHGEWYVAIQVGLFLLVILGPRTFPYLPAWRGTIAGSIAGWTAIVGGGFFAVAGGLKLGRNLTPVPFPKDDATLIQGGPYAVVRHPIYSGLIFVALGWALVVHGWLTVGYAMILLLFFDIKSRREERWLREKFDEYPAYQKRVSKLIPWLY